MTTSNRPAAERFLARLARGVAACTLALTLTLGLAGCDGSKPAEPGRVAILDLTQVAKDAGRDKGFEQRLQASVQDIESRVVAYRGQLRAALDTEKAKLGPVPTREQLDGLQQKYAQADEQFRRARTEAQNRVQQLRATMVGQFRDEVRPIANRIARRRGMTVVMLKHEGILDADPSADITDEVAKELKAMGPPSPTTTTAPAPTTRPATMPATLPTTLPDPIVPFPSETTPEFSE